MNDELLDIPEVVSEAESRESALFSEIERLKAQLDQVRSALHQSESVRRAYLDLLEYYAIDPSEAFDSTDTDPST